MPYGGKGDTRGRGIIVRFAAFGRILRAIDSHLFGSAMEDEVRGLFFLRSLPCNRGMNFFKADDPVRYGTIELAIKRILKERIEGSFAEVGVWRGYTSRFIHDLAPDRTLFLFDTFEGFPSKDLGASQDSRFKDTSVEIVTKSIGDTRNVRIMKGYFPDTTKGLENERFAFVMLDLDLYDPTFAGLNFFYDRLTPGGYLFLHDFNTSDRICGVYEAATSFFKETKEDIIELPDAWGSAMFRKNKK